MELLRSRDSSRTTARPFGDLLKFLGGLKAPTHTPLPPTAEEEGVEQREREPEPEAEPEEDASLQSSTTSSSLIAPSTTASFGPTSVASTSRTVPSPLPSTETSTSNLKSTDGSRNGVLLLISKGVYAAPEAAMEPQHLEAWALIRCRLEDTFRNIFRPRNGSDATLSMEFMMAGPAMSSLKPSVVIVCCSSDSQKQLKKIIKTQKWLAEYDYHFIVIVDRLWELSGDNDGTGGRQPLVVEAWNRGQDSGLSGVAARSRLHKDGSATTFTIGGVIVMGGSLYGLTAGHVFARQAHESEFESESPEAGSSSSGGFEGSADADEEDDDDDSPFVFFTAAAAEGRSEPQSDDHGRAQPSMAASKSPDRRRVSPRALGAVTVGRPSVIGSLYQSGGVSGRHLDWALVKLQDPYPSAWRQNVLSLPGSSATETISGVVSDAQLRDPELRREVWINCGMSGLVRGRLLHSPASLLLRGGLCEVWQVLVDTQLVPGDSGSWVIREGRVCGHIIATREAGLFAYMLSMEAIVADMRVQLDRSVDIAPPEPFLLPSFSHGSILRRFQSLRPQNTLPSDPHFPFGMANHSPEAFDEISRSPSPTSLSYPSGTNPHWDPETRSFFPIETTHNGHTTASSRSSISIDSGNLEGSPRILPLPMHKPHKDRGHGILSTLGHYRYGSQASLSRPPSDDARSRMSVADSWGVPLIPAIREHENWKPIPMRWWYLSSLLVLQVTLIAALATALSLGRAIQLPLEEKSRIAWLRIAPMIAALIMSPLWETMASAVARMDPFYHLTETRGDIPWTSADDSVNLDYVTRNPLSRLLRSLADGHYVVATSSLASLLCATVLPVLSTGIISIHTDAGPDSFASSMVARVSLHPRYTISTVAVFAVLTACVVVVFHRTIVGRTGLGGDVQGIAGLAALATCTDWKVRIQDWEDAFQRTDTLPMAKLHRELRFRSAFTLYHGAILANPLRDISWWSNGRLLYPSRKSRFSRTVHALSELVEALLLFFLFKLGLPNPTSVSLALIARLATTLGLFCASLLIWAVRGSTALDTTGLMALLVCARFIWNQVDNDVRLMDPWLRLHRRNAPPSALWRDLNRLPSPWVVITAMLDLSWPPLLTASVSTGMPIALLLAARYGALPRERSGGSSSMDDTRIFPFVTVTTGILSMATLIVTIYRIQDVLPRHPASIASVLCYFHQSSITTSDQPRSERLSRFMYPKYGYSDRRSSLHSRRYGLGWFRGGDGVVRCGVECEPLIENYRVGDDEPRVRHRRDAWAVYGGGLQRSPPSLDRYPDLDLVDLSDGESDMGLYLPSP